MKATRSRCCKRAPLKRLCCGGTCSALRLFLWQNGVWNTLLATRFCFPSSGFDFNLSALMQEESPFCRSRKKADKAGMFRRGQETRGGNKEADAWLFSFFFYLLFLTATENCAPDQLINSFTWNRNHRKLFSLICNSSTVTSVCPSKWEPGMWGPCCSRWRTGSGRLLWSRPGRRLTNWTGTAGWARRRPCAQWWTGSCLYPEDTSGLHALLGQPAKGSGGGRDITVK